jgi:hypothetical protein
MHSLGNISDAKRRHGNPCFGRRTTMNTDVTNLTMTPEEENLMTWCYANLEGEQIAEVEAEALEIAMRELNAPIAGQKLLELMVNVFIRNGEKQRCGGR